MDKITYLAELAEGLARWVPERERQDILRYYAEYFEEAGQGREAEVVAELGDPWALSCRLAVEGGYVTHEKAAAWKPQKTWRRVLAGTAVGLTIFALVFGVGLLAINVIRTASGRAWRSAVITQADPETAVDWGWEVIEGEYNAALVDEASLTGPAGPYYFMDGDGGYLDDFGFIDIDISLGNIQVVAGDGFTLSIGHGDAMEAWTPTWEVINGVLRLRDDSRWTRAEVNSWKDFKNLFGAGQQPVKVIITVPNGIVMDNINVEVGLGNVLLWGLNAQTVTVETGVGNVECYEAREVRKLELNTGMGDVNLILEEALYGLNIGLESGMGNVEATLCGAEDDYSYKLESGLGLVTVNGAVLGSGAERRGNAPLRLNAESGTGSVNVYFN